VKREKKRCETQSIYSLENPDRILFRVIERGKIPRKYECGHWHKNWFRLAIGDMETKRILQKEMCPMCYIRHILKHAIHCAQCGKPILPGEQVVAYPVAGELQKNTQRAGGLAIGCMRMGCCSQETSDGVWTFEGFQKWISEAEPAAMQAGVEAG
jgi:predicted nucleic acid-binding Zn ribbon protein